MGGLPPVRVLTVTVIAFFAFAASSWAATVTKSNSTFARVDNGSAERSVSYNPGDFPAASTVTDVVVTLDFAHIDNTGIETNPTCGPPPVNGTLNERNDELGYDLRSPSGTTVSLIAFGTYAASPGGVRVSVKLDDAATSALSGPPASGTFRPSQALSTFDGQAAGGTWTLVAKDSGGGDPLCHYGFSLTLTVDPPPNSAPTAGNDTFSTAEDSALTVPAPGVLGNDSDPDGDPLTATLVAGPAHGTLTLNANGAFTYTPAPNYNGPDSFSYRASDGALTSGTATVSLTITAVNDAPSVAVAPGGACGSNHRSGTLDLTLADVDDPVGSLTLAAASDNPAFVPAANVAFGGSGAGRSVTLTTVAGRTGTAVVTVTVSDGARSGAVQITLKAGGNGKDGLVGTAGSDILLGQNGKDTLSGLGGIDLLCGARGKDTLTGDAGADHFSGGQGKDTATDLTSGQGDTQDGSVP